MCSEPQGSDMPVVGECPECGSDIDADGDSTDICAWSPSDEACETCGSNPCSGYC